MKAAYGVLGSPEKQQLAEVHWATTVLGDLHGILRKVPLEAPVEVDDWMNMRLMIERHRRPRTRLKPSELALMVDVGDFKLELRLLETENASMLEHLLHAARILWQANNHRTEGPPKTIYDHIAEHWGVMPPQLEDLGTRKEVESLCRGLVREEDVMPSWFFFAEAAPAHLLEGKGKDAVDTEGMF